VIDIRQGHLTDPTSVEPDETGTVLHQSLATKS